MNKENFKKLYQALAEANGRKGFTMDVYGRLCGTPACVLGHYAVRVDLQDFLTLTNWGGLVYQWGNNFANFDDDSVIEHFDISEDEAEELFGPQGCGGAQTRPQALEYLRKFAAKRGLELT